MRKGFSALVVPLLVLLFIASTFIALKFLNSKTQEAKTTANEQKTTEKSCNGLAGKSLQEIKWNTYEDSENKFSIEYPSVFTTEKTDGGVSLKVSKDEKPAVIWLNINSNPKHIDLAKLWAENPPNDHAGELVETNYSQRLKNANNLLKNAVQINVGTTNIKGYSLTIGDTLERISIYWLADSNIYNLGYSPQDQAFGCLGAKKEEIANHMVSSFEQLELHTLSIENWKTYSDDKISFKHPDHFYISNNMNGLTEWRSTFGDFHMILKSSDKPIIAPKMNQDFPLSDNNKFKVLYIDENNPIEIDGKTVQWFSFGCLADCNFHMISFNVSSKYYQLIFDVAGGGLPDTFNTILETLKFTTQ